MQRYVFNKDKVKIKTMIVKTGGSKYDNIEVPDSFIIALPEEYLSKPIKQRKIVVLEGIRPKDAPAMKWADGRIYEYKDKQGKFIQPEMGLNVLTRNSIGFSTAAFDEVSIEDSTYFIGFAKRPGYEDIIYCTSSKENAKDIVRMQLLQSS